MTHTNRIIDICLVVLFLCILFFPIAAKELALGVQTQEMMAAENRTMAPKPTLFAGRFRYSNVKRYPERMENYLTDTLPFRQQTISRFMREKTKLFDLTIRPARGVIGKNNWLFFNAQYSETIKDFLDDNALSKEKFTEIFNRYDRKRLHFASLGVDYYAFIAPNKVTIHPEFLPDAIQASKGTPRREQFMRFYREHIAEHGIPDFIIDPVDELLSRKAETGPLYYPQDTHWNWTGRIEGGSILLERLRVKFPGIGSFPDLAMHRGAGITALAGFMNIEATSETFLIPDEEQWDSITLSSDEKNKIYRNNTQTENILLVGDSFLALYHPMPEAFAFNTVIFHEGAFDALPAFEKFRSQVDINIVVEEHVERAFFP